ncbi:THAP domain-containing protein 5-like [Stegastes partitus]|uniref:THAP domain-containing protein 5-like n=1 Tax=Stegastes partitus TaxID=144197 RepID=A0A3B5BB03_9TELE|nr:PREDICTED: THAP domain-containing protein 5-like [Stegastes partitus]
MPKYCSVPNCKNDSGNGNDRKSFYKFPLQDPVRLQQWLRNMGRENWTPSRHQYICHEHFAPSCFKVRWGIRYLESDAVPTLFQEAEKRKATDHSERKPKRLRANSNQTVSDDGTMAVEMQSTLHTVHLYEIAVNPLQQGETSLVESSDVGESDCSLQTDLDPLASADGSETGINFPLTLFQTVDDLSNSGENTEVVVMSECPAGEGPDEFVNGITAAILTQGHRLVINDSTLGCTDEADALNGVEDVAFTTKEFSDVNGGHETQVIAYFETIPNVFPSETSTQFNFSPDTVLSSALSSKPITSTVPIVSKHVAPSPASLVLTVERLDTEGEDGDEGKSDEEDMEQQDRQLEEHCYHKNSLSKEQLEAIVAELQKKVKVLQQRHRRHLEKLLGLENTVSQLRQSNLLNEERLQLLERAYIQTSAAVSDAGETVTIIYEEDDAAYLYTPLNDAVAKL